MQSRKLKRILITSILLISGFLCFSYWYMVRCEGQWDGDPVEKLKASELIGVKKGLVKDVAYM